jgi:predicted enzyme related to lactoylglutathione lyase
MADATSAPPAGQTLEPPPAAVPPLGAIGWADLTVPDADAVRDFYADVVGWAPTALSMGAYSDYLMQAPGAPAPQAGVCHARGSNAGIPAVWLVYITVADLAASLEACRARGGEVVSGPRGAGGGASFAIIRDPAGAVAALFQPARAAP